MSGGGNNGAWEAGVLWGLLHYGDAEKYKYDVVTGVSIGSVNAAGLALWKIGDELKGTEWLSDTWKNLRSDDVYHHWLEGYFGGEIFGIFMGFWRKGFYDTEPGLKWLKETIATVSMNQN